MVVLGGVTRLTGSGLSITDWKPVTGVIPPLSADDWADEFERYRASPEFRHVNPHMDVHLFKGIYWLEYLHRLLGRIIGVVFLVPFLVFAASGSIRRRDWPIYLTMFLLGGLQGVLGWYRVQSGLVDVPEVSQYRLVAHLVAALAIYAFMFWVALSLLHPRRERARHPAFGRAAALVALVALTVVSGGFVAGLDAGHIFNSFPRMGEHWLPPGAFALAPAWRNFFENPILVQFDHRLLAICTLIAVCVFWSALGRHALTRRARSARHLLLTVVILQAALGVGTLLLRVPLALAATHQAVAVLLLTAALYAAHALREPALAD
jgi:cytochrome c oxidase assembly protein subunit 15